MQPPCTRTLVALSAALVLTPLLTRAEDPGWSEWEEEYDAPPQQAQPRPDDGAPPEAAQAEPPVVSQPSGVPEGQWVQTQQYGWLWMPYAEAYTWAPADGYGEPAMYVYRPAFGWCWLAAPWVWGLGPWPRFGVYGYVHFGWYGHGWWRTPHRWHWAPGAFHRGLGHDGWRGGPREFPRPLPAPRGFSRGGGPVFRGGGFTRGGGAPTLRGSGSGRGGGYARGGAAQGWHR